MTLVNYPTYDESINYFYFYDAQYKSTHKCLKSSSFYFHFITTSTVCISVRLRKIYKRMLRVELRMFKTEKGNRVSSIQNLLKSFNLYYYLYSHLSSPTILRSLRYAMHISLKIYQIPYEIYQHFTIDE